MMLRFMTAKSQFQCAIHQNKKDGGMLIVKTVFREFALPACNDSFKISCHVNLFKIGCLFMLIYSFFVANKNKNCCNKKDIDMSISPIEKFIILIEDAALQTKIFMGKKANLVKFIWFVKYFVMFLQPI